MKSLLDLPSKEFRDFIGTVQDYQQTSRLGCVFWYPNESGRSVACFGKVFVMPDEICLDFSSICIGELDTIIKRFKRDDYTVIKKLTPCLEAVERYNQKIRNIVASVK